MTSCLSTLLILVSSHANSLTRLVKARAKPSESTTSVIITRAISSHKSSSLWTTECKCPLLPGFSVQSAQEASVCALASAKAGAHRDCLVLASFAQQPELESFPLTYRY